jgi:large subunit ribosomal protein L24
MKIKKGDEVVVIAGKDKGATGTIISVDPKRERVVVEGVNMVKRHLRENNQGRVKEGGIVTQEAPIQVSNVMFLEDGKRTRVGYRFDEDGKKVRISRRTGKDV